MGFGRHSAGLTSPLHSLRQTRIFNREAMQKAVHGITRVACECARQNPSLLCGTENIRGLSIPGNRVCLVRGLE